MRENICAQNICCPLLNVCFQKCLRIIVPKYFFFHFLLPKIRYEWPQLGSARLDCCKYKSRLQWSVATTEFLLFPFYFVLIFFWFLVLNFNLVFNKIYLIFIPFSLSAWQLQQLKSFEILLNLFLIRKYSSGTIIFRGHISN